MDKDYSTYKINQLLDDDYFVMSERYPTPENIKFWNNQIKRFPQLSREIELARKTIAAFREESVKKLSEEEIDTLWDRIKQENFSNHASTKNLSPNALADLRCAALSSATSIPVPALRPFVDAHGVGFALVRWLLLQRRGILPRRVSSLEMGVKFSRYRATFR